MSVLSWYNCFAEHAVQLAHRTFGSYRVPCLSLLLASAELHRQVCPFPQRKRALRTWTAHQTLLSKRFFLMLRPYYRSTSCGFGLSSGLPLESQCRSKCLFVEQVILFRPRTNGAKHAQIYPGAPILSWGFPKPSMHLLSWKSIQVNK